MTCNKGQKPNELLKIKCGSIWINMNVIFYLHDPIYVIIDNITMCCQHFVEKVQIITLFLSIHRIFLQKTILSFVISTISIDQPSIPFQSSNSSIIVIFALLNFHSISVLGWTEP